MTQECSPTIWRILAASICGASHERANKPNQDAIDWNPAVGVGTHLCAALSDGHGSPKSFRSREGAEIAVKTATHVLPQFLDCQQNIEDHTAIKRATEDELPKAIVGAWERKVRQQLDGNPFVQTDWEQAPERDRDSVRQAVDNNPLLAYGATLLTVVVLPSFIMYPQVGDGDVLCVTDDGEVSRPLLRDERLIGNETTSLCLPDAWRDVRIGFQTLDAKPPALILMSTDGYANAFRTEADFLKVGSDVLNMIHADGLDAVQDNLEGWLREASDGGSEDDVTVGIICRTP